jgi:hypothetical protein
MEKETAPPPQAEDKKSVDTDNETASLPQAEDKKSIDVDKEVALPQDRKSVDMTTTSLEDQPKNPEKVGEDEKGDDEYPQGLKLFFIMLGLCLAVFLIAIGKTTFPYGLE